MCICKGKNRTIDTIITKNNFTQTHIFDVLSILYLFSIIIRLSKITFLFTK